MAEGRCGIGRFPLRVSLLGQLTAQDITELAELKLILEAPDGTKTDIPVPLNQINVVDMTLIARIETTQEGRHSVGVWVRFTNGDYTTGIDGAGSTFVASRGLG